MQKSDFSFSYGYYGYMIKYKGHNIGGAGTIERGRRKKQNLRFYLEQAKITLDEIQRGIIPQFMLDKIKEIQDSTLKKEEI